MREANEKNVEILAIGASRPMCDRCRDVADFNEIIDRVVTSIKHPVEK